MTEVPEHLLKRAQAAKEKAAAQAAAKKAQPKQQMPKAAKGPSQKPAKMGAGLR